MRKFKFGKLVRDKMVQSIIDAGNTPHWRSLSDEEFLTELKNKLAKKAEEASLVEGEKLIGELSDLQEIIDSLLIVLKVSKEKFTQIKNLRNEKDGSFEKKHYIDNVEAKDGSEWVKYYLDHPKNYPEVKK